MGENIQQCLFEIFFNDFLSFGTQPFLLSHFPTILELFVGVERTLNLLEVIKVIREVSNSTIKWEFSMRIRKIREQRVAKHLIVLLSTFNTIINILRTRKNCIYNKI